MPKKFGTFAGVFTPSILTILGVIMYLRLGWVVGQAGLYATIGLILLAHVISISTGLSLSSIATDKKIKTGGIYYMLSRSLGLPIGGAIGITLFIGTALSIALYIVGFVENFIGIEAISNFLGMQASVNVTRLIGTIVIIILVILAYISTSIAIKTQFFILGAIGLSLISVIVGIFNQPDIQHVTSNLSIASEAPDLIVIFAIFFPAVTGFTAGVAMSGDLKSPKSSIPFGTLTAIGVGLVIYIGLAILFGLYVDRELLINDTNFLMKVAWFSPLVVAGIWGATLSSALGGLLGAPRILQAMSIDRITPSLFGKGAGKNNEPRQALIFTFLIAELGILIGELDVIAAIVSMFYIAAYGFINLAYALESWANSDFRPSLKIPKWVGVIGFIASMAVMFKIDTLAMIVSLLIVFGIYILLKRKEIQGNNSNVWQSVWTSLVRSSLHKISQNPLNEKNWEPNIILFSGGTNVRKHLLNLGSNFVGDHGFLSNFDLKVNDDEHSLLAKKDQNINSEISDKYPGVYTRQQSVNNLYEGIETIAQNYGFSGVEPNTVMMGWARQSSDPVRFVKSINNLVELDMNVLLVDYDKKRGYGKYKKIDVWWRGGSTNGNLALYFAKFLLNSDAWENAEIRLLIVNDQIELTSTIYENSKNILENLRIKANIIIIDNEIEQNSFYDIIKKESLDSDLIFLGFPHLEQGHEQDFVERTNKLCADIGTVVLIKSASLFKEMNMGDLIEGKESHESKYTIKNTELEKAHAPQNEELVAPFENYYGQLSQTYHAFLSTKLRALGEFHNNLIQHLLNNIEHSFQNLGTRLESPQTFNSYKKVIVAQFNILLRAQNQYLSELNEKHIPTMTDSIARELPIFIAQVNQLTKKIPSRIKILRTKKQIQAYSIQDKATRKAKNRLMPLWLIFNKFPYYVHFQQLLASHFPHKTYDTVYASLIEIDQTNFKMGQALINTMQKIADVFDTLKHANDEKEVPSKEDLLAKQQQILGFIQELSQNLDKKIAAIEYHAIEKQIGDFNAFSDQLSSLFPNVYENYEIDFYKQSKKRIKQINLFSEVLSHNLRLIYNQNILNNGLLQFIQQTKQYLNQEQSNLIKNINDECSQAVKNVRVGIESLANKNQATIPHVGELIKSYVSSSEVSIAQQMLDINDVLIKKIKNAAAIFPDKLELYSDESRIEKPVNQLVALDKVQASVSRTIDYLIEKEINGFLREFLLKFGPELQQSRTEFNKLIRQINLFDDAKNEEENPQPDWDTLVSITVEQLRILENTLASKSEALTAFFDSRALQISKSLQLNTFVSSLTNLKQFIRIESQKREFERIRKQIKRINTFFENQLNKIWYNQSSGLLLARKLSKAMLRKEVRVKDLLQFNDKVSISKARLQKIPDYYKQLFLRKQFYPKEFWVGRETEFASAKQSFAHFRNGYKGGILVTGERNSGKSFFINQLLNRVTMNGDVYHISAPYTGSTSPADLLSALQSATEKTGTYAAILNKLPNESILVFDDLELWWEKSPKGMRVIDQLIKLIEEYSSKHIFLFACDINAFKLINHYRKIESHFINLIELSPMNAKEIKEAILKRHQTSGMQFHYKNASETALHSWKKAKLFSSYFNYSEGNIGVALSAWIAHIDQIENTTLYIRKPELPNVAIFNYLETDWMIFIMQFILHKRMNLNKLVRITRETESKAQLKINILKRAGIVIQLADGILELNPYILPFLQKALIKRQLF